MAPYQSTLPYQPPTQPPNPYTAYIPRFHPSFPSTPPSNSQPPTTTDTPNFYTPVTTMTTNPQTITITTSNPYRPPTSITLSAPPQPPSYHPAGGRRGWGGAGAGREGRETVVRQNFRSKSVCMLTCKHCEAGVCKRGMKAILLADMTVELFSTDVPPFGVQLVQEDYQTRNCQCRIRDVACLGCGNVIGYHVTQPCPTCMEACNNGHFWMFHIDQVDYSDRLNPTGTSKLVWANIPRPEKDMEQPDPYDLLCR